MAESIVTKSAQEALPNDTLFGGGPTVNRPTNPRKWFHYFDTDLVYTVVWDGATWRDGLSGGAGTAPQGEIGAQGFSGVRGSQGTAGANILA